MQWRYREKRNDQEHDEKVSFSHLAKSGCFFLFVFELYFTIVKLGHVTERTSQ